MKRACAVVLGILVLAGVWAQAQQAQPKHSASAIQVLDVQSKDVNLPAQFQMALYEHMIEEIQKTGKFKEVYRDGDKRAAGVPDLVTLSSVVWGFKEGSARQRQVTTVSGATHIKVHVKITDRQGNVLVEKDVEGAVHFLGENLRATYNFGKSMAGVIRENF